MTVNDHRDLPGEQGNTYADDMIGSGQKTVTGHAESDLGETGIETGLPENESALVKGGSGQKTATAHGKRANATMTAFDALDLLTANGKGSESENDGHGHENYSTVHELSYPSVLLDPKIGNYERITRGSGPPKSLSIPHVVERAARNGERQPRKRSGQGKSAATEQLPPLQLPKELEKRERARAQQTTVQRHSHSSRWTEIQLEGRKPPGTKHQVHPETPPSSPAPLKGGKEKRKKSQAAKLPKELPRGKKPTLQVEQSLKGEKASCVLYRSASSQTVPADQSAQMSQVMSLVQTLPLHLVKVGWGSRSKVERKAPHFLLPTPGQIRNSRDIAKKGRKNTQIRSRRESPVHPPQT